jgi:2-oxoglutarate ferredoxin oxidoreductase subunit alpha
VHDERIIMIAGEAGQGLITIGQILVRSLARSGYEVLVTQDYQSRIRGGHNAFTIRAATHPVLAPRERVDVLVALDTGALTLHTAELSAGAVVIADEALGPPAGTVSVPLAALASKRHENVAALGVVAAVLGLEIDIVRGALEKQFGKKDAVVAAKNEEVLAAAYAWHATAGAPRATMNAAASRPKRLVMDGNEAIALGAISAGVRFCAFYPMTPGTSIALALAARAEEAGLVVEQVEDEIAAINMALGASFAGAPSMVATSGGGFALMVEGVSLAGMTETPVVIVVAQRPAPATGLPTRTAQEDLEFVLHAGHGEFPRAIYAPGSVEECFHLTRAAFEAAERSQGPVFVLTDQYLADSVRAVAPFDAASLADVVPGGNVSGAPAGYRRYELVPGGVSPRRLPGASEALVVADSDEHDEAGHITEDLVLRAKMVRKRLQKMDVLRRAFVAPSYDGDESPELMLVSWGSTRGAALEASAEVRRGGTACGALHFPQVWPLAEESVLAHLKRARRVAVVEGNATGQFARLLRTVAGANVDATVLRYDGLPVTPEYILSALDAEASR